MATSDRSWPIEVRRTVGRLNAAQKTAIANLVLNTAVL